MRDKTGNKFVGAASGLLLAFGLLSPARAEVVDKSANGFTVKTVVEVAAPPAAVYRALVEDIGAWWDSEHTWSGNARNLSIDARAGGCFCEKLDNGGSVQHMQVVWAAPGQVLRLRGALGPLQELGADGSLTWMFEPVGVGTRVVVTYAVGGYHPAGFEGLAVPVDTVLGHQVEHLKLHAEKTEP